MRRGRDRRGAALRRGRFRERDQRVRLVRARPGRRRRVLRLHAPGVAVLRLGRRARDAARDAAGRRAGRPRRRGRRRRAQPPRAQRSAAGRAAAAPFEREALVVHAADGRGARGEGRVCRRGAPPAAANAHASTARERCALRPDPRATTGARSRPTCSSRSSARWGRPTRPRSTRTAASRGRCGCTLRSTTRRPRGPPRRRRSRARTFSTSRPRRRRVVAPRAAVARWNASLPSDARDDVWPGDDAPAEKPTPRRTTRRARARMLRILARFRDEDCPDGKAPKKAEAHTPADRPEWSTCADVRAEAARSWCSALDQRGCCALREPSVEGWVRRRRRATRSLLLLLGFSESENRPRSRQVPGRDAQLLERLAQRRRRQLPARGRGRGRGRGAAPRARGRAPRARRAPRPRAARARAPGAARARRRRRRGGRGGGGGVPRPGRAHAREDVARRLRRLEEHAQARRARRGPSTATRCRRPPSRRATASTAPPRTPSRSSTARGS